MSLVPGSLVEGVVHSCEKQGLVVSLGELKGCAHITHLSQHVNKYSTDIEVTYHHHSLPVSATTIYPLVSAATIYPLLSAATQSLTL